MSDEPTNEELQAIEAENMPPIEFSDIVLYLENGVVLVSRVIMNIEAEDEENQEDVDAYFLLFRPAQLYHTPDGNMIMQPWVTESDDEYYPLEKVRVMITATPRPEILQYYREAIGVSEKAYSPEDVTLH